MRTRLSLRSRVQALGAALLLTTSVGGIACVDELTLPPAPPETELRVGESRVLELRYLRLDVTDFKQTLTLKDLKNFPREVLAEQWLMDMDVGPFVVNVLKAVKYMPPEEAYTLAVPARNLWKLLNMTPENANLTGTSFEAVLGTGEAVGIAPSKILADMVGVNGNEAMMPLDLTAQVIIENLISTHPNTKIRRGPVTPEHPDGLYPVAPHSLPVMLEDVANGFASLSVRYGPMPLDPNDPNSLIHPGFLKSAKNVRVVGDDFRMQVKVSLNALPYKGVDASIATVASVNSVGSQIDSLFDFSDPNWIELSGLLEPSIGELTMLISENKAFLPGGYAKEPLPLGNSPVWATPPWEFEHVLASAGVEKAKQIPAHCTGYGPQGTTPDPFQAVELCVDGTGWIEVKVDPSVILESPPPSPSYFWDVLLEVAQARLHDGGISEGDASIELKVRNVPIGTSSEELSRQIRQNMEANPRALRGMAEAMNDTADKDADFYYVQAADGGDWLYFVSPGDIRKDEGGFPVRAYAYEKPGFYGDSALTTKVSSTPAIEGDVEHEKLQISEGATFYLEDDLKRRFEVLVGKKPSLHRISLTVKRIQ